MRITPPRAVAVASALLLLTLAGCGNSADSPADTAAVDFDGEVAGTINVWTWDGAPGGDTMDALAAAFEKETGVVVDSKVVSREDYTAQVQLALNSGESIDVLGVQPSQFATEVKGNLVPVSEYESKLVDGLDGYSEGSMEQIDKVYEGGDLYSVPLGSTGSAVCFYNADILDEVGVAPPQTWDDVQKLTEALAAKRPETLTLVKPSGADTWFEDEFVLTMAGQLDPSFYDEIRYGDGAWDTPAYVDALARYGKVYEDGTLQRSALDLGYADAMAAFTSGKAAMACNGTWEAALLLDSFRKANGVKASQIGAIPVPADDAASRSLRSFLDITWGIPTTAENGAAAAAFISFASQGEGVDVWAKNLGFIPAAADWELDPSVLGDDQVAAEGYATIQDLVADPSSDRNNLSSLSGEVGKLVEEVAHGRMSAQDAAGEAQKAYESGLYN